MLVSSFAITFESHHPTNPTLQSVIPVPADIYTNNWTTGECNLARPIFVHDPYVYQVMRYLLSSKTDWGLLALSFAYWLEASVASYILCQVETVVGVWITYNHDELNSIDHPIPLIG